MKAFGQQMILLVAVATMGAMACGPRPISLERPVGNAALDYGDVQADWTRAFRLYEDFESRVVARATYFSPTFVEAYLQEYDRVYRPVAKDLAALRSELEHRAVRSECFFLSFFTGNRDWNDLALSSSTWRLYLEAGRTVRLKAQSITQLEGKAMEHLHFFPYHDDFSEAYLVCFQRFPHDAPVAGLPRPVISPEVASFALSFHAPLGTFKLSWELD